MLTHDNPAARLHHILTFAKDLPPQLPCPRAWEKLLVIKEGDTAGLYEGIGRLMRIPDELNVLIEKHFPVQLKHSFLWRAPIDSAFKGHQMTAQWETFSRHITDVCLAHLLMLGDLLHTKLNATLIEDNKIQEMIDKFGALVTEIRGCGDIPDNVKLYLIDELTTLIRNLDHYHITGGADFIKQSEAIIGHLARDKEFFSFAKDHEIGKRVMDEIAVAANFLTVALGLPQLTITLQTLLK